MQWPHDTNLSLNVLLCHTYINKPMPPTLMVQMDNCCRENKNKFYLGMMALLVKLGHFREVYVSFLITGHTHEDIDARFGHISQALRENDAITLPALMDVINKACPEKKMLAALLKHVFDISNWLLPCLNKLNHITQPHMIR